MASRARPLPEGGHGSSALLVGQRNVGVQPAHVKERSREAHVADHRLAASSGGDLRGPPDDQRHAKGLLVHQALVEPAVVSEEEALVRGVDHDGVLGQAFSIEPVEKSADPSSTAWTVCR